MIKNYLISSVRSILRHKFFTLINIFGLSVGIATSILIYMYVNHELNFDKTEPKYNRIYRIVTESLHSNSTEYEAITPYPLVPALRNELTLPESITRIIYWEDNIFSVDLQKYKIKNTVYVEPDFFDIFDIKWIVGSKDIFKNPDVAVLTRTTAIKLFGKLDVVGKLITLSGKHNFTVQGIVEDHLELTNIPFEVLLSYEGYSKFEMPFDYKAWGTTISGFQSFLVLKDNKNKIEVEKQINEVVAKNAPKSDTKVTFSIQPLSEIRTDKLYGKNNLNGYTNKTYFFIAIIVGVFVLILGCINYINLSLLILIKRRKEIGVRKVNGAKSYNIIWQFTFESLLIILTSMLLAILLTELFLPILSNIFEDQIYKSIYSVPSVFLFISIILAILVTITGILPSFRIASTKAVEVFKNDSEVQGQTTYHFRNSLIVFQFLVSAVLIISTIVISSQLKFIKNKNLGYSTKNIVNCPIPTNKKELLSSLQTELQTLPDIEKISFSLGAPTSGANAQMSFKSPFKPDGEVGLVQLKCVDYNYLEIFKLDILAGRWWNNETTSDSVLELIVNETFIEKMNFPGNVESLGTIIEVAGNKGTIIGVIRNFHSSSLRNNIEAVVFAQLSSMYYNMSIKLKDGYNPNIISTIQEKWEKIYPNELWEYQFFDDFISDQYKEDTRTYKLTFSATWIAISIALLGLFGISGYTIQQKLKSICIRKIHGATMFSIVLIISKRFVFLVVIANIIGIPVGLYASRVWLNSFAYHINLEWYYFVITFMISVMMSILVISYYTIKAARENPANILRYE